MNEICIELKRQILLCFKVAIVIFLIFLIQFFAVTHNEIVFLFTSPLHLLEAFHRVYTHWLSQEPPAIQTYFARRCCSCPSRPWWRGLWLAWRTCCHTWWCIDRLRWALDHSSARTSLVLDLHQQNTSNTETTKRNTSCFRLTQTNSTGLITIRLHLPYLPL